MSQLSYEEAILAISGDEFERFADGVDPAARIEILQDTLLHVCCLHGTWEQILYLLIKGFDPNATNSSNFPPIANLMERMTPPMVYNFIEYGMTLDTEEVLYAIIRNCQAEEQELIDMFDEAAAPDAMRSPMVLTVAGLKGYKRLMRMLLSHGYSDSDKSNARVILEEKGVPQDVLAVIDGDDEIRDIRLMAFILLV